MPSLLLRATGYPVRSHEQALEENEQIAIAGFFRCGGHTQRVTCLHHSEKGIIGTSIMICEHPLDLLDVETGKPKHPALSPEHLLGQRISGLDG